MTHLSAYRVNQNRTISKAAVECRRIKLRVTASENPHSVLLLHAAIGIVPAMKLRPGLGNRGIMYAHSVRA